MVDFSQHPCFNPDAHRRVARVHLPVAPDCNVGCNFCNRKFDCLNESRPGVTSAVLSPHQALAYMDRLTDLLEMPIGVVGIAGPGDPFANVQATLNTLRLVREHYPRTILCVASNGLNLAPFVDDLADLETSHVTITVNAVDPEIGSRIYRFVRFGRQVYRGRCGAELLWARQKQAIEALKSRGIMVKINSIILPSVNDHHIKEIARTAAALGADVHNCIPLCAVEGTPFGSLPEPDARMVSSIRADCAAHMPQMSHCARCRADAAGLLGDDNAELVDQALRDASALPLHPEQDRPYVAVATLEGILVNQHLGEADEFAIFARQSDGALRHVENRPAPVPGGGDTRWSELAERLHDCRALLCAASGQRPKIVLGGHGIRVLIAEGLIEEAVDAVYSGQKPRMPARVMRPGSGCDSEGVGCGGCSGPGTGCG